MYLTSLSLQEKSFFRLAAHFSGRPAASRLQLHIIRLLCLVIRTMGFIETKLGKLFWALGSGKWKKYTVIIWTEHYLQHTGFHQYQLLHCHFLSEKINKLQPSNYSTYEYCYIQYTVFGVDFKFDWNLL